jgi:hypothetical protein
MLWRFETRPGPTQFWWTWLSGTTASLSLSVYGVRGVPSLANTPAEADNVPAMAIDPISDDMFLFGTIA